jgi:mono/diheme cytochrome c family protein
MNQRDKSVARGWLALVAVATISMASCDAVQWESPAGAESPPTFAVDIARIIFENCSSCHRPGQAGPFPLLQYEDVRARAERIEEVTASGYMPPWPADLTYTRFRDEQYLTRDEIDLIGAWVEAGAPAGDLTAVPELPPLPLGSQLGSPDLVVEMTEPFLIPGDNTDRFVVARIPFELPRDTFIRTVEFVPGNRALVHHMNGHLITFEENKKTDLYDGAPFVVDAEHNVDLLEGLNLRNDDGSFAPLRLNLVNYLPGVLPALYPKTMGAVFPVSKKNILLLNTIHYGPSARDTFDVSRFNIFFGPKPQRVVREFLLGTHGIAPVQPDLIIPPDTVMTFRIEYRVPMDISVLTVNPHMHLIGREYVAYAVTLMYDTIPLVRINDWDFRWQYFYTYRNPVRIPAGSLIVVEGTYDNTTNNPFNPFSPPRLVQDHEGSMKSTDEMLQLIVTWTPYIPGDERISLENVRLD